MTIDDVSFRNDSFPDGSRQTLDVKWTIPSTATNPVILTLDLPEGLQGYSDKFDMIGPDGEVAGTCTVSAAQVVCTVDPAFIDENPEDVSGTFRFDAQTTFKNKDIEDHTFDFGSNTADVTVGPNPNWCTENCSYNGQGFYKWGNYNNLTDEIDWYVQVPAGPQGIEAGKTITVTDPFDPTEYELVDGGGLPRVYEGGYIATNEWGRENVIYSQKNDVTWSEDKKQVSFTSVAGRGQDAELGEGERGTDGSFYIVQWRVKALTGGTLQPNGNRTFTNSASYTIDGDSSGSTTGSSTRYSGGGTVVGRNYGKIQVTKELAGDTTLTPTFTVNYTAYDSSDAALPGGAPWVWFRLI